MKNRKSLLKTIVLTAFTAVVLTACSSNKPIPTFSYDDDLIISDGDVNVDITVNTEYSDTSMAVTITSLNEDTLAAESVVFEKDFSSSDIQDSNILNVEADDLEPGSYQIDFLLVYDNGKETVSSNSTFKIAEEEVEVPELVNSENEELINEAFYKAYTWYSNLQVEILQEMLDFEDEDIFYLNGVVNNNPKYSDFVSFKDNYQFNYASILSYIIEKDLDFVDYLTNIEDNLAEIFSYKKVVKTNGEGYKLEITFPNITKSYGEIIGKDSVENYSYKEIFEKLGIIENFEEFANPLDKMVVREQSGGSITMTEKSAKFTPNTNSKYAAAANTPVYAPFSGEIVELVESREVDGLWTIVIESVENGRVTLSRLSDDYKVRITENVEKGQLIGYVSDSKGNNGVENDYINVFYAKVSNSYNFDMYRK